MTVPAKKARKRALAALFVLLLVAATAGPLRVALQGDLASALAEVWEVSKRHRRLAEVDPTSYEANALERVRRSCRDLEVTRLDEIPPAAVEFADDEAPAPPLLDLDGSDELEAALEPVDAHASLETSARGVRLLRGQLRVARPLSIPKTSIGSIEIVATTDTPGHLLLGWSSIPSTDRIRRDKARVELRGDGAMHSYVIDAARALERGLKETASVRRLFVESRVEGALEIAAIRVFPRTHRFRAHPFGATQEDLAGQRRAVLYQHVPGRLAFDVTVPSERPVFETGLGVVGDGAAVEFDVSIDRDGRRETLLKRLAAGGWEDQALDLSEYAGSSVRISLAVRGSPGAVALWSAPTLRPRRDEASTRPFLVVLEDALRADRLSTYGGPAPTPAHDRIAARGLVFENAYSQSTQTRSSVPSVMTSLLPSATGTWDFSDALSERYVTLAEVLRSCGFATASFIQNGNAGPYAGLAQGFDMLLDEESFGPKGADLLDEAVDRWIDAQRGRSYFAYIHVLDPHGPFDPHKRPELKDALADTPLPRDPAIDATWLRRPTAAARHRLYDAEIEENDVALGAFLDRLHARGDLERATVAIIADHGEFLGEHGGMWRHHFPGYREVTHVPFLLAAPGAAVRREPSPVALLDLMPTLLDLARIDAGGLIMDGRSLAPLLLGKGGAPRHAVPGDEMAITVGQRRAGACGSVATRRGLWVAPCTHDESYQRGYRPQNRDDLPRLRFFAAERGEIGDEASLDRWSRRVTETTLRAFVGLAQSEGVGAWRNLTAGTEDAIASEPAAVERLRGLGYLE